MGVKLLKELVDGVFVGQVIVIVAVSTSADRIGIVFSVIGGVFQLLVPDLLDFVDLVFAELDPSVELSALCPDFLGRGFVISVGVRRLIV